MKRYLVLALIKDLGHKYILISGPRQVGKTTLTKSLSDSIDYLNYDIPQDKKKIIQRHFDSDKELTIFDELHKMNKWKLYLKGLYDAKDLAKVIVTGSARLNTFRKAGDSLAGRYFHFHLMPLDLKELKQNGFGETKTNLEHLLSLSGFPEPFLAQDVTYYNRWRQTHLDVIIKEDVASLEPLKRIRDLEYLVELMRERVGNPLSYNSLREDLSTDDKTVKRWLTALEESFVFFKILPFSRSIKNGLKKAPKFYFYDIPRAENEGARLENLVALSLYKECLYRNDVLGESYQLFYLRNKQHKEVDFLIVKGKLPIAMIEVKTADDTPSKNFSYFETELLKMNPKLMKIQLVKNLNRQFKAPQEIWVKDLALWLEEMAF
ncbi:MAG: ATP-binding protein [Bacteriovoracia bacterium]